jgi:AraC-like DNA-binding protein
MRNLELKFSEIPPANSWVPRTPGICFLLVAAGRAAFTCSTVSRSVSEGDVVVLKTGSPAVFTSDVGEGFRVGYFYFSPECLDSLLTLGERRTLELRERLGKVDVNCYSVHTSFANLFARVVAQAPPPGTLVHSFQMLQLVAALMNEEHISFEFSTPEEEATQGRVLSIVNRMSTSELMGMSVHELARICGCSRRHLARIYREHFGTTISAQKMQLRLEKAARLLRSSNAKVVDVALECGFSHLGQFSSKFRKHYGLTPAKWRHEQSLALPLPRMAAPVLRSTSDHLRSQDSLMRHAGAAR